MSDAMLMNHGSAKRGTELAAKTYTPGTSNQVITADHYLTGDQTISGDSDLIASNIKKGVTIFGVTGTEARGTDKAAATYTPSTTNQTIPAGTYLTGTQTISGDADLIPSNIKKGVNIFGVTGTEARGTDKAAATYTPGTSNQTINAGYYLTGAQTIKGDANLKASNIKTGTSIFGITGTSEPVTRNVFLQTTQPSTHEGIWLNQSGSIAQVVTDTQLFASTGVISTKTNLPTPTSYHHWGSTKLDNKIYLSYANYSSNVLVVYDISTQEVKTYSVSSTYLVGGGYSGLFTYKGNVYIPLLGTSSATDYLAKLVYNSATNTYRWDVCSTACTFSSSDIGQPCVIGDIAYYASSCDINRYDMINYTIENEISLGTSNFRFNGLCTDGTYLYGILFYGSIIRLIKVDVSSHTREVLSDAPEICANCTNVEYYNGYIYLFGGSTSSYKGVYAYSLAAKTWGYVMDLNYNFHTGGICQLGNGVFYLFGGNTDYKTTTMIVEMTRKTYPNGTVIIERNSEVDGAYHTELYSPKLVSGTNSRLTTPFDNVYYYTGDLLTSPPTYYGDGTGWTQIK